MANEVFVPSICKDGENQEAKFKGEIVLKIPDIFQRAEFKDIAQPLRKKNEDGTETVDMTTAALPTWIKLIKMSEPYYQKVDIKSVDGAKEFKSFQDLTLDVEVEYTLYEVVFQLIQGFGLGKR